MLNGENTGIIEQIGSAKLLSNWLNGCGAMGGTKGVNSSEDDQHERSVCRVFVVRCKVCINAT